MNSQCDHGGHGSDHGVLQDSQLTPEQQHPVGGGQRNTLTSTRPSLYQNRVGTSGLLLLSHGPRRAAAEWRQVGLLLLDLQHEHQAGVLVTEEVQQEHQEVVDDVGLVALAARVHVDGQAGIAQSEPLDGAEQRDERWLTVNTLCDNMTSKTQTVVCVLWSCDSVPSPPIKVCCHGNLM